MKKVAVITFFMLMFFQVFSQDNGSSISLIPVPVAMQTGTGKFTLKKNTAIELSTKDADAKRVAGFLSKKLSASTGFKVPVKVVKTLSRANGYISFALGNDAAGKLICP